MEKKINKMSELHNKIQKSCCKKLEKSVKKRKIICGKSHGFRRCKVP